MQIPLKCVNIKSSCISREVVVNGDEMFLDFKICVGKAVAPTVAKLSPFLKYAAVFLQGSMKGIPAAMAVNSINVQYQFIIN